MQPIKDFQEQAWDYYARHGRNNLLWRQPESDGSYDPYKIMVSEVMLQQTQVSRVTIKYREFLKVFPTIADLSRATFADVLKVWSGLGYNRRAKFLLEAAKIVTERYGGHLPKTKEELVQLPGIGPNTAAAILVYAYNQPHAFIETNIRSVFIHHFFNDADQVSDKQLLPIVERAIDTENPREWYWALMDYGTYLKAVTANPSRRSRHYTKQSKFEGSNRQLRARVLKLLLSGGMTYSEIATQTNDDRTESILVVLAREGLITHKNKHYYLA